MLMDTRGIMKITSGCLLVVLWTVIRGASGNALQDVKSSSCDCEGITEKLRSMQEQTQSLREQMQTLQEQMQTQQKLSQSEQEQMQSQQKLSQSQQGKIQFQQEQTQSLQEQIQFQQKHSQSQQEQSQSQQEQMQSQIAELSKLIVTLLENKKVKYEFNTHKITKREIPSDGDVEDSMPGLRGPPGRDGLNGRDGLGGLPGRDGVNGRDGRDGVPGSPVSRGDIGTAGPPGSPGSPGILETRENGGAVYTRWGRATCGDESTLLYDGFAGGSRYDHIGGGVDYQCMPLDPEYNSYSGDLSTWYGSWMAGVEYQSHAFGLFPNSVFNQNVPCARCYTRNRAAVAMIPAKRTCPVDWTKEYEGYLMAGNYNHNHQTTFECVDANPEYIKGQEANTNGALFYFIKPYCSGTATTGHCPPYYGNRELTCVVCTK